ncbi:MAG: response regulator [Muribaculaceae bacterium]|nr:response regulator [Muribaculaceae bacterium]
MGLVGRIIVLLAVIALTSPAYSAEKSYSFKHINSSNGLSASYVKSILRDSRGFVWFGTKNGLNVYNGLDIERLKCYDHDKKHGNDNIGALYEDKEGKIWIGTDRGIFTFKPSDRKFHYLDNKASDGTYVNNYVLRIAGDEDDNVWVLSPTQGLFRYHDNEVEFFSNPVVANENPYFIDFALTPAGNVYAVTNGSDIYLYKRGDRKFTKVASAPLNQKGSRNAIKIITDGGDNLYVSTLDGYLYKFNPRRDKAPVPLEFSGSGNVYMRDIALVDNELWIGTHNGLYILDLSTGKEKKITENPIDPFSLSDNSLSTIYRDYEGHVWLGTAFAGVEFLSNNPFRFNVFGRSTGLSSMRVRGLDITDDGKIWIGTENNGLNCLDPVTGEVTFPIKSPAGSSGVMHFVHADGNKVYTGFTGHGVVESTPSNPGGSVLPLEPILGGDGSGYCYLKDSNGVEWIGSGGALTRRRPGETSFSNVDELHGHWVFSLIEDSDGNIWIGTMGNGLWKHVPSKGTFKNYTYDDGEGSPNGLRSNSINSIMQDSKGNVWISTDRGGLSRYNKATDDFTTYCITEGLPDNVVYEVLEDSRGFLWFGTNKGLVKFNPDTNFIKVFSMADGLPFNEFSYNSAAVDPAGMFYFGGVNGIISFNPLLDTPSEKPHPVYFTSVQLLDSSPMEGQEDMAGLGTEQSVTLPSDYASFSVTVASPEYGVTGQKFFYYRLLPVSQEWKRIDGNKITFANLASGNYTLEVRYGDGEHASVNQLKIKILPPWWQSTWAIVAYIVIAVMAVILLILLLQLRNKRKIAEREQRFSISKEKELYRNKVNFFTEIAHEIRTPLSLIDIPLEALEDMDIKEEQVKKYVHVMRQNTTRLLQLTTQLLDFQKIDSSRMTLKPECVNVSALLNQTIDRFEPTIRLSGKNVVRNIPETPVRACLDKEALTKIMSNLLNNALKYSQKDIEVTLSVEEKTFSIAVASDGEKISFDEKDKIFEPFYQTEDAKEENNGVGIGLPLSRSLAMLLGGSLTLLDNDDERNVFVISLPLNSEQIPETASVVAESNGYLLEEESNQTKERSDGYTVLLVEDNDNIRHMLADQLRSHFFVETAPEGGVAMEKLKGNHVDIVVTDIMMPGMDGMELCRRIKENADLSHLPVVFITAKNDMDSKIKGIQAGAEAYIEKPFSVKYLRQLINSLLDNRRRERESFSKKPFFNVDNMQMNKADEEFMNKVIEVIHEHISEEDFNVETLTDVLCMSRSNLLRKIKSIFNLSPLELIRLIRLKRAAELLKEGKYRIGEICLMVGISSPSYFSKLFFRQFNVTPKDFALQCQEQSRKNLNN